MTTDNVLLTTEEAAAYLGVTKQMVGKYKEWGLKPHRQIGRADVYMQSELAEFAENVDERRRTMTGIPQDAMTTAQTCAMIGVSRETLYKYMRNGIITPRRIGGGRLFFDRTEVETMAAIHAVEMESLEEKKQANLIKNAGKIRKPRNKKKYKTLPQYAQNQDGTITAGVGEVRIDESGITLITG